MTEPASVDAVSENLSSKLPTGAVLSSLRPRHFVLATLLAATGVAIGDVLLAVSRATLPVPAVARSSAMAAAVGFYGVPALLFGVWMAVGLVYGVLTRQTHALSGRHGLQAVMFVALGVYFVYFWTRSGQTLAMQTWHIRLVTRSGGRVSPVRAASRYLLAWLWFLPALAGWWLSGLSVGGAVITWKTWIGSLSIMRFPSGVVTS